jgi:hypothetical protein
MSLIARRRAELNAKLGSLSCEFQHWKDLTALPGFGRQNSQVRRVAATIDGALDELRGLLGKLPDDSPDILAEGESWETEILAAHSVWEVFRSKLVLREDDLFRDKLAACDDLAWECYSPARNLWEPERKGPPLVYFSATWSPFAMSRDSNFQNEIRAQRGTAAALGDKGFQAVLQQLPIPLISIPWYQVFHLPGAILIAHEVGHVVESDFGLSDSILSVLEKAPLKNKDVWKGWKSEMFADVFGVCAMGPAFAGTMLDLNASSVSAVTRDDKPRGLYPPRNLRVRLLCEALRKTGHEDPARRLLENWTAVYGAMTALDDYAEDLPAVADALLAGPYRGISLTHLISFPASWSATLEIIGQAASQNMMAALRDYVDPRQLFAAARWLHENPQWNGAQRYDNLLEQMIKKSATVLRAKNAVPTPTDASAEQSLLELEKRDRISGAALRELMLRPAADLPRADAPPDRPIS